ncbi:MAG: penicillin-binding protein 2, partial [Flavobacterium sp.]
MRKLLLPALIILGALALIARLFYLQIIDEKLKLDAENNAIKIVYEYPERGYIYDRNGKLLVANQPSYDLNVIPKEIKNLDTLEFCKLLNITKDEFDQKLKKAINYSRMLPSPLLTQLNRKDFA